MYKLMLIICFALLFGACEESAENSAAEAAQSAAEPSDETVLLKKADPAGEYGDGVSQSEMVAIAAILASPEAFEGKTVAVQGEIVEVCPMRGCWVDVEETGKRLRVKVTDGEIVFPLSAVGSAATVEGIVEKLELSEEKARDWMAHEAQEKGESFDPNTVKGPQTIWRIKGKGAVIQSKS